MSGFELPADGSVVDVHAEVVHKPGTTDLKEWPLLVEAPGQYGEGIRTEDKGISVDEIATKAGTNPDHEALAKELGTTAEHIAQALAFVAAQKS